jgi:transmembrane sensor
MEIKNENKQYLLDLIERYVEGTTTNYEVEVLINYYESFQNSFDWPEELGEEKILKDRMLLRLQQSIKNETSNESKILRLYSRNILKYAAIFIGIVGIGYFFTSKIEFNSREELIVENKEITLQLDNGTTKTIDPVAEEKNILNSVGEVISVQKKGKLLYEGERKVEKLAYNQLRVPRGKRFEVVLSDGTKVHLNAGTSFKYPVKFIEGENREVYLEGEAYFVVAKDKNHPFIVNTSDIDIRVLGTQFNVSSYKDDDKINTVLVEGSVSVSKKMDAYNENNVTIIEPGFSAVWNKNQKKIELNKVNTEIHTSWISGKLVLKNTAFKNIRKKIERQYNVTIINHNKKLDNQIYNVNFDAENIQEILKTLNESFEINYKIVDNQIIIN